MKTLKIFFSSLFLITLISLSYWMVVPFLKSSDKKLDDVNAAYNLNSSEIVSNFTKNKTNSDSLYVGKIIEITGFVKKVNFINERKTVILYTKNNKHGIICDTNIDQLEKLKSLKKNQKITVKGTCKGFLMDVILLNCYIDLNPNE
ncbi:hypothetical protein [uncultured Polaribacter sp.]|uniref:OB-fold protein n=1 Tax=uncultured Polaribacter sp. TaxID=174711 RepID=UPI002624BEB4|nr:hypothetical protein [uncultured Polaribacter sp.]